METGSVLSAMRPFLRFSRLAGVYPIFRRDMSASLLFAYNFFIFASLGYSAFGVILWLQEVDILLYDSLMHLSIEKAQKGFLYLNYTTVFAAAIYYHLPFSRALADLNKVERSLHSIDMRMKYKMNSIFLTALVKFTTLACLVVSDYFLSADTHWLFTTVDLLATYGTLVPIFAYELQFFAALTLIAQDFNFIRKALQETFAMSAFGGTSPKIHELIRTYDRLRSASMELNRISSVPILITSASIFFLGIVNVHLIGIAGSYKHGLLIAFLIGSILLRIYELWTILRPFVTITEEVDMFNSVLFRFMIQDKTGVLKHDDKLYLHIAMKKGIRFTAWEFFVLDYTLIQSVVGSASTLLVILIQYSLSKRELWCEET